MSKTSKSKPLNYTGYHSNHTLVNIAQLRYITLGKWQSRMWISLAKCVGFKFSFVTRPRLVTNASWHNYLNFKNYKITVKKLNHFDCLRKKSQYVISNHCTLCLKIKCANTCLCYFYFCYYNVHNAWKFYFIIISPFSTAIEALNFLIALTHNFLIAC